MVRWAGCTAWPATAPSAMRWVLARSPSRGRGRSAWTDKLPAGVRGDADVFLLGAAAGGAELRDLGKLAEEIRRQCARPDTDDGFAGRSLRLDTTFEGAGKLDGNLTPQCAAAVQAVLDALGKRRGPQDERTKGPRLHDALEDACRRLIARGCLPDVAGSRPAGARLAARDSSYTCRLHISNTSRVTSARRATAKLMGAFRQRLPIPLAGIMAVACTPAPARRLDLGARSGNAAFRD
jgi:hypothetical protein